MAPRPTTDPDVEPRVPLSRERVLDTAVAIADRDGLEGLSMRRLAQALDVEAMSLYHHVANKDAILDGVIEVVLAEINAVVGGAPGAASTPVDPDTSPAPATSDAPGVPEGPDALDSSGGAGAAEDWRGALRRRILAARSVMLRHPWVPRLLETRTTMSPAMAAYHDGVIAIMRAGGLSYDLCHHAVHALGSRALGFTQELYEPDDAQAADADAAAMLAEMADRLPHLVAMIAEVAHDDPDSTLGWCDDQTEFEFGLDLILDGLERRRAEA